MRRVWATSVLPLLIVTGTVAAARTPVEVRRGGDDGLTIRFSERLGDNFRASTAFVLSGDGIPATLIATIPTNLRSNMIGQRLQFDYDVEFATSSSKPLGSSKGVCWEDEMSTCAKRVVEDAMRFTPR